MSRTIERNYAVTVMEIPSHGRDAPRGLSVYAVSQTDADGIARDGGEKADLLLHGYLHDGVEAGFYRCRRTLHN